jgi:drug/metabolite transporter (DMT)-like permease
MRGRSLAVFLLIGVLWGSEWLVTRNLETPPIGALALRYAMAAVVLGAVVLMSGIPLPRLRLAAISALTGISFAAVPALLIGWASPRVSPGLLVVILAMTPLLAALMEGQASGRLLVPLVGGVAGTTLIASQGLSFALTQWVGAAAVLAAGVLIAASVLWVKRVLAAVPVVPLAAIQLAAAAACIALWSFSVEGRFGFVWSGRLVRTEAVLAIAGSALALPPYYWLLRRLESFQLTASQWLVTVVGVSEGLMLVREAPRWRLLAGGGILLASLGSLLGTSPGQEEPVTLQLTALFRR